MSRPCKGHCREYPKKRSSKPTRKTSKHLDSGRRKVLSAVARTKMSCSDFSLIQRNGTCYMSASTLMFARIALRQCTSEHVRAYVRRSMANAWDDAQGRASESTCPLIPKRVRQFYALMLKTNGKVSNIRDAKDVQSYADVKLTEGGTPEYFLVALFWASGIDCLYTSRRLKDREDAPLRESIFEHVLSSIHALPPSHPFYVLNLHMKFDGLLIPKDVRKMLRVLNFAFGVARGRLVGVLMKFFKSNNMGHVVSLYPCYSKGVLSWVCCNSWSDKCSKQGFVEFVKDLHVNRDYRYFYGVSLILKGHQEQ